jgi:hypothetical protein
VRRLGATAAALVLAVAVSACADAPPPDPQPITATASGQGFALVLNVAKDRWAAGEPIDIGSTLTWTGPAATAGVWTGDPGPVAFSITQVDGPLQLGAAVATICKGTDLVRGKPLDQPYVKSLGWSEEDPHAAFYRAFANDPLVQLPVGRWRVTAEVDGFLGPCDAEAAPIQLRAQADFVVE